MGMGFAPTWLRQVSPLLHKTTLTTADKLQPELINVLIRSISERRGFTR